MEFFYISGLSSSKKIGFICFNQGPLKMMNNDFYFILKAFFVKKAFTLHFCHHFLGYLGKRLDKNMK